MFRRKKFYKKFNPTIIYRDPNQSRVNSFSRYIGNRVINYNKNFLCALTGGTGEGKSWLGVSLCEIHSKMFDIPFDVKTMTIHNLLQLLKLIKNKELEKNIRIGTPILFEEPQVIVNARNWQSDQNKMLSILLSTFRDQRLVVFFSVPYLSFIDKQSRILFHSEIKVRGFNKSTGITTCEPRLIEYNSDLDKIYRHTLKVRYTLPDKRYLGRYKILRWEVPKASDDNLKLYEEIKKEFSVTSIEKLYQQAQVQDNKTNKMTSREQLFKVRELYLKYNGDTMRIMSEIDGLSPYALEKYLNLVKKEINMKLEAKPST